MSWESCVVDYDYEINNEYPYPIRKKSNKRIVREWNNGNNYMRLRMNGKNYYKHRVIAFQWIDNPNNYDYVDHIDRDSTNNHISNLRFVSASENNKNKSSRNGIQYTLIDYDDAPDDLFEIDYYNQHKFENYYYSINENRFYFDTGLYYRELPIFFTKHNSAFVNMTTVDNTKTQVYFTKFKKMYQIE